MVLRQWQTRGRQRSGCGGAKIRASRYRRSMRERLQARIRVRAYSRIGERENELPMSEGGNEVVWREPGERPRRRKIERLAIVNRGEAAVRCIRTAKSLRALEGDGLDVVALFTTPDRDAPFVRQADRAFDCLPRNGAVAAYLDHDGLLARAARSRCRRGLAGLGFRGRRSGSS